MVVKIETFNGCDEKALKGTAEVAQLTTVYMCTGQGSQEPSMCMDIYSLSPAAYAVWEGMDAHLLVVYGFSIIKIVKVHQCYMDMIYDTMDKDGNINTFPLFGDINICTPKWPSLCHSICPDFSYCDRESWLWGYVFLWICSEGLCICWALIGRIFCSCIYHWCPSHFLPHWCCFLPRHNYVAGHQMQLRELLQLCHVHGQS